MAKTYNLPVTLDQIAAVIEQLNPAERQQVLEMLRSANPPNHGVPPSPDRAARELPDEEALAFSGLNGLTGEPLLAVRSPQELFAWIQGEADHEPAAERDRLLTLHLRMQQNQGQGVLGVIQGIDELDPKQAGWGVIFHPNTPQKVRDALQELVHHRRIQCGRDVKGLPVEFEFDPVMDSSAFEFRLRYGQGHDNVNPDHLPYYLLIVGPPSDISFRFQYNLDAQHAVGRLHFDEPDDYKRYVDGVLAYESAHPPAPRQRRVVFFAPDRDKATGLSAQHLAGRLHEKLNEKSLSPRQSAAVHYTYRTELLRANASRQELIQRLKSDSATFLFTATHGLGFPKSHGDLQRAAQGAIVCQEWPGAQAWNEGSPLPDAMVLKGADVRGLDAHVRFDGLIVFAFGCYTAGTPECSDFHHLYGSIPLEIAEKPFVARLPQELLRRGALAFIGHVDRAWFYSFGWPQVGAQTDTFQSALEAMLVGEPVGHALEYFQLKYLNLNNTLTEQSLIEEFKLQLPLGNELTYVWTARNDARAYILLGDPLVRLYPERLTET
jgi:hypothetical protein